MQRISFLSATALAAGLKAPSTGAKSHSDYRRLLEDKSLDAVTVATLDHWHARLVIDPVEAGKDVYVEEGFRGAMQRQTDELECPAENYGSMIKKRTCVWRGFCYNVAGCYSVEP